MQATSISIILFISKLNKYKVAKNPQRLKIKQKWKEKEAKPLSLLR